MYDFARAQDTWYETWPQDPKERGMAMCVFFFGSFLGYLGFEC